MAQVCARMGCNEPAVATFSFNSDECFVWIDRWSPGYPGAGALCARHADRLTAPRGWQLRDRRPDVQRLWTERPTVRTAIQSLTAPRFAAPSARRASRPRAASVAAVLPLDGPIAVEHPDSGGERRTPEVDRLLNARSPLLARAFQPSR